MFFFFFNQTTTERFQKLLICRHDFVFIINSAEFMGVVFFKLMPTTITGSLGSMISV